MKNLIFTVLVLLLAANNTFGASYYCNPATGSMSNSGTLASPWSTMAAVFTANKTFVAGDTIFLMAGFHGAPSVKGTNSDYVTIKPYGNDVVGISTMGVANASHWIISGLNISPELAGTYSSGTYVGVSSSASYITVQNCFIYGALDISSWTIDQLNNQTGVGINCSGPHCLFTHDYIKNTGGASGNEVGSVDLEGAYDVLSFSTVENFMSDGLRTLTSYVTFEYNIVKNAWIEDSRHDDFFQSWTFGAPIYGVVLRGNTFIAQTDPNQPFPCQSQGVSNFDGYSDGWDVENNLVVVNNLWGITFNGVRNSKFINNTVMPCPIGLTGMAPTLIIAPHKDGTQGTGNIARNNLCSSFSSVGTDASNNMITSDFTSLFVNYNNMDFHLRTGSPAINAGTTTDAPAGDLALLTRDAKPDLGCYEFVAGLGGDHQAPTTPTGLTVSGITQTGFRLAWTASTDNIGVIGYKVSNLTVDPLIIKVVTDSTRFIASGLPSSTTYHYAVQAFDADGNESAMDTLTVSTLSGDAVVSSGTWHSYTMPAQTGTFIATYDATPNTNAMDGVVGIQYGTGTAYSKMATAVRFYIDGMIEAQNGGSDGTYAAATQVYYTVGQLYHFRLVVRVPSHNYDIYVTPDGVGQTEKTIGLNYGFRVQQQSITSVTGWSLYAGVGTHTVGNMKWTTVNGVEILPDKPVTFELSQNYPNPFNPTTSIKYQVPKSSFVKVSVYNILGVEVKTLVNEEQSAGSYAVKFDANGLSSGVYFYKIQAGEFVQSKKMLLTK